ncbi:hypothetical protein [Sporosarcina sp. FSL K6-5500]|uniref:hypothetical protein n=1 Tax=Sporosarcina sp. FSL K6-5500 TaxID=2921558 RepID=UPI0030F67F28
MTLDDLLIMDAELVPELIHCPLSDGFHWLRITAGHTPARFKGFVQFELSGYEYMYKDASMKDEIISEFSGSVKVVDWKNEM